MLFCENFDFHNNGNEYCVVICKLSSLLISAKLANLSSILSFSLSADHGFIYLVPSISLFTGQGRLAKSFLPPARSVIFY